MNGEYSQSLHVCSSDTKPHSSSSVSVSDSSVSDSPDDMELASESPLSCTGLSISMHLLMQVSTGIFCCISF